MSRILRLFLVPLVIFSLAMAGLAQDTPTRKAAPGGLEKKGEAKPQAKPRVKPSRFAGDVVAVDLKAGTLTVKDKDGKERTFTVEGASAKARLQRARAGQVVRVGYQEKEGQFIATSLSGGLGGHEPPKPQEQKPAAKGMEKQEKTEVKSK